MKKLMIAAAIVCAAITSQAVSAAWGSTVYCDGEGAKLGANEYTGIKGTISAGGNIAWEDLASYTRNDQIYAICVMTHQDANGNTDLYSANQVYNKAGSGSAGSDGVATFWHGVQENGKLAIGDDTVWFSAGATPTPEPTSGLLLLLGVAGLALRRRRA